MIDLDRIEFVVFARGSSNRDFIAKSDVFGLAKRHGPFRSITIRDSNAGFYCGGGIFFRYNDGIIKLLRGAFVYIESSHHRDIFAHIFFR